jgi:Spy/CpxP family protein refolding chaperone
VLVAAVAFAVAGVTSAQENRRRRPGGEGGQPPGGGAFSGRMMGGGLLLLANESVQKELKITDEQKTKIKEFADAQQAKMREFFQGGQPDREKMAEAMREGREKSEKFVKETLNADQQKRYKQITLQQAGMAAFATEDVQKQLKFTDDQKDKLKSLGEEMRKDMTDLGRGFDQETMQKRRTITKEYNTKAMETLTDEQKKAWKEMTGEPFEIRMDAGRGGDRRRPGGEGGTDTPRRRPGGENRPPRGNDPPPA